MSQGGTAADPLRTDLDNTSMKRRTVRGAGATAVAQALKFFLQFGSQIVLARLLDPAQFGLVAMVAPVLGLVLALNDFGLGQAIVQRSEITSRQVSALFWMNLALGAGFTAAAMLAAPLVALLYGEPRALGVTLASASLIFATSLAVVPLALLNRQMRFVALATIEVVAMTAGLCSGIAAAWLGAGYWSIVIMQAVNAFTSLALAWLQCGWRPGRPAREPGAGALMRFGAHLMGSNFASYLSTSADNVIVGVVNGPVALGLYDRSYNLVVKPLAQLMAPVSRVAVPLLSRLQESPERYRNAYLLMLQLVTVACVPGLIATIVCAEPLISLLLGAKWSGMAPIFGWVCFGGIAAPLSSSTYWLFVTQNRTAEQMRVSMVCAAISVASFAVGSYWGATGVAMVAALSFMLIQTPLAVWAATRRGPLKASMVLASEWPLLCAALIAALAAFGLFRWMAAPRIATVLAVFAVAYAAFLLTLFALPAGRRLMASARGLLGPRPAVA